MKKEKRCLQCEKLLFIYVAKENNTKIEIKCNKCKLINKIEI